MFRFFEQANFAILEGHYSEAKSILEPYITSNALASLEYTQIDLGRSNITGENHLRVDAKKQLEMTESLLDNHERDDNQILGFAKDTIRLNRLAITTIVEGYRFPPNEGAVPLLDDLDDAQLIYNFRILVHAMRAEIAVSKAMLHYYASSLLKSAYYIRKGYKSFETAYNMINLNNPNASNMSSNQYVHPDLIDYVNFGMGSYWYILSIAPKGLQSVLGFLGFTMDKKKGIEMVRKSVFNEGRTFASGVLVLSLHYVFISSGFKDNKRRLNKFTPVIDLCVGKFKYGPAINALISQYHRKFGHLDLAIEYNIRAIDVSQQTLGIVPNAFLSDLGQCYYVKMDFPNSIRVLEQAVNKPGTFDGKGLIALYLLCAYNISNKPCKPLLVLLSNSIDKKSRIDKYATEKLKVLKAIEKNDKEFAVNLFCTHFDTIYARDRMDELDDNAEALLKPMLDLMESQYQATPDMTFDTQAARLFVFTTLSRRLNLLTQDQIINNLKIVINMSQRVKYEHQWSAFANYELAKLLYLQPNSNKQAVMSLLQLAMDTKSYAMEEVFQTRIKTSMLQCQK
ncbi:tetratricopeptide-repeat protein [Acrasis kona]|uniref:Tetratricopeptide-repeat protein n=1 Tax=Acrasis kona TaxID=1008807 RepID=A0AAW2Z757_9EUKA